MAIIQDKRICNEVLTGWGVVLFDLFDIINSFCICVFLLDSNNDYLFQNIYLKTVLKNFQYAATKLVRKKNDRQNLIYIK